MSEHIICDCDVIHEDIVDEVNALMPESKHFHDLADLYKMFSDSTRIKILWALSCHEMCVCDLAVLLNKTKSAVSHQLKFLRMANLVKSKKNGKIVMYSLADKCVKDILDRGFMHIKE